MDLRIFTEPQLGASYDDLLRVAKKTEETGFDAFFRSDHFLTMGTRSGLPGPTDSWVTLGAIARETSRIRLGTLVTSATFRYPSVLAISVAQVDQMSGGRVEFGFGAGWYEAEHKAYGIELPPVKERFDRYAEQLAIITGLWETAEGATFSFDGDYYQLADAPALPKPAQSPRPPVIIGGAGKKRTPALAARYADEFNAAWVDPSGAQVQFDRVDAAAREIGRDPKEITRSIAQTVAVGANDAEVARRAAATGREVGELKQNGLAGTPAEVLDKIGRFREEAGVSRAYLQVLDLADLDHLELIAAEVMSKLD
ncbi:LLM class F420-dependent oxidoreductase [Amycolatopsis sp. GM8]|uniref:LLM class F420-dependent oxidoreductase n=1 Tax=Amycolatopsis sp. GM8 TaxID=2896530 RepID=UPI001F1CD36E|nr:LLM class F420-dependent oxidoreductase [Amycolatopsis sp. GM8]